VGEQLVQTGETLEMGQLLGDAPADWMISALDDADLVSQASRA
jgi:hypothetical protein